MKKLDFAIKKKIKQAIVAVIAAIAIKVLDTLDIDALWSDILAFVLVLVFLGMILRLLYQPYGNATEKKTDDVPKSGTWKK